MQFSEENEINCSKKTPFNLICDVLNSTVDDLSVINDELRQLRERSESLEGRNQVLLRRLREALRGVAEVEKADKSTQSDILDVCHVAVDCMEKVKCIDAAVSMDDEFREIYEEMDLDQALYSSNLALESISMDYSVISPVSADLDNLFAESQPLIEFNESFNKDKNLSLYSATEITSKLIEPNQKISKLSSPDKDIVQSTLNVVTETANCEVKEKILSDSIKIALEPLPIDKIDITSQSYVDDLILKDIIKANSKTKLLHIEDIVVKPLPAVKMKTKSKDTDKVNSPSPLHQKVDTNTITEKAIKPSQTVKIKSKSIHKVNPSSTHNEKVTEKSIIIDKNVVTIQKSKDLEIYSKSDMLFYLERYKISFLSFVQSNTDNVEAISGGCKDLIRSFSNNGCESDEKKRSKRKRESHSHRSKIDEKPGVIDTGDKCTNENNRHLYDDLDYHDTLSSNISESDKLKVGGGERLVEMSRSKSKNDFQKIIKRSKVKKIYAESWKFQMSELEATHDVNYESPQIIESKPMVELNTKNILENEFSLRMKERFDKKYSGGGVMKVLSTLPQVIKYDITVTEDTPLFHESKMYKNKAQKKDSVLKEVKKDSVITNEMKELVAVKEVKHNDELGAENIRNELSDHKKDSSHKKTKNYKILSPPSKGERGNIRHGDERPRKRHHSKTKSKRKSIYREKELEEGEIM